MKFIVTQTYEDMSKEAARLLARAIKARPGLVIALPTGGTPIGTLRELVNLHQKESLDFSKVVSFNMDEYKGLSKDNPQGYYYYLYQALYKHVNIDISNTFVPDVCAEDAQKACKDYNEKIERYGNFDFILLGIGTDGHISFNLPGEKELHAYTHLQDMNEETIQANSRFFANIDDVPGQAITIGIANILFSKKIVLIANGKNKAAVIAKLMEQETLDPRFPASMLLLHKDVTIIADEEAAGMCNKSGVSD